MEPTDDVGAGSRRRAAPKPIGGFFRLGSSVHTLRRIQPAGLLGSGTHRTARSYSESLISVPSRARIVEMKRAAPKAARPGSSSQKSLAGGLFGSPPSATSAVACFWLGAARLANLEPQDPGATITRPLERITRLLGGLSKTTFQRTTRQWPKLDFSRITWL